TAGWEGPRGTTPLPIAPTPREPITISSVLRTVSSDSTYRVIEAPTVTGPTLVVVSVTAKLPPGEAAAGGLLTAVTARSAVGSVTRVVWAGARQVVVSVRPRRAPRTAAAA